MYFKKRTQESSKNIKNKKNTAADYTNDFISEKRKTVNKITLVNENGDTLHNEKVVADEINNFFKNATKNLGITENTSIVDNSNDITDPFNKATDKFKNHPCILLIQSTVANDSIFSFNEAFLSDIEKELRSPNPNKA